MTELKEVTVSEEAGLPAVIDLEADAGSGFEHTTSDELSIPFFNILQKSSPELDVNDALKAGMLYNTVTEEFFEGEDGVVFYPASYQHVYVEWVPRQKGGGFVGIHDRTSETVLEAIKANGGSSVGLTLGDNDLIETFYLYAIVRNKEGDWSQVVIPFTSTKIKGFRDWLTRARQLTAPRKNGKGKYKVPLNAVRYVLKTEKRENEKGVFWVAKIGFDKDAAQTVAACMIDDPELYAGLKDFADMIESGRAKADVESQNAGTGSGQGDGEEIPF